MSEDSGDQTELPSGSQGAESRNRHEQILDLYNGGSLGEIAIGLWSKIFVEFAIVSSPLIIIIVLPGLVLTYLDLWPFSYSIVITGWVTISTTIFGITWCFLESDLFTEEESNADNVR